MYDPHPPPVVAVHTSHRPPHSTPPHPQSVVNECITLVVNGLQLMRVRLPKHEAGASSKGTMHILPSTLKARADTMHQCDARLTPVSLLVSGLNIALPRDSCVKSSVRFTGEGHEHDVSFKDLYTRMESDLVNDVVGFIPTHVTLHLKYHATCVVRDEEQEVLEALREIIADEKVNPRGGSITSALANDILKEKLPKLYEFVIRRKHGNLENFLNAHQDVFTLFTFSDKALKKKTVSPEPRIVLKAGQRELCTNLPMSNAEIRLHEYLHTILGPKDMDKRDLLDQLSNDMTFATFLSPTLSILMRFLSRHKDQFVWSMDPDKPTVVGLQGRQHDSACLGQQADLDKQMPHPANKKYPGKGDAQDGQDRGVPRDYEMARGGKDGSGKGKGKGSKGKGGRGAKGGGLGMDDAWQQGNKGGATFGQRDLGHGAGFVMNSAIAAQGNQMLNGTQVINGQYQYQQQQPQNQFVVMQGQQPQFAPQFLYESPMKQQAQVQAQVQAQAQAQAQLMPGMCVCALSMYDPCTADDMSMLDMIGNDSFDQLYRQGSQPELVPTSDGSFLFVEQGQERQQQAQQQAQAQQQQTQAQAQAQQSGAVPETVFLHEVSTTRPFRTPLLLSFVPFR